VGEQASPGRESSRLIGVRRKRRKWPYVTAGAVVVVLIIAGIASSKPTPESSGSDSPDRASVSASSDAEAPATENLTGSPGLATSPPGSTEPPAGAPSEPPKVSTSDAATAALGMLAFLPVAAPASSAGYSRDQFGQAWSDDVAVAGGHNGCDTRNDILRRDLTAPQIKAGTQGCVVLSGTLSDPYTGLTVQFTRGQTTSEAVQIDHLVALSDAWQTGAQQLTASQRQDFANDPLNLQAVTGTVNAAKGDSDAADWLPPNPGYRCEYVDRQIQVKTRYTLWVTPAERDAITSVLIGCGAAPDPTPPGAGPLTTVLPETPSQTAGTDAVAPTASSTYYKSCAEARAAGAAPLYVGQPGYRAGLDGDHDGVACEPPR